MKKLLYLFVLTSIFLSSCSNDNSKNNNKSYQENTSDIVKINDVRLHKDYKNVWAVKGMVKNISNDDVSGYVKIKFIDNSGNIRKTVTASVNDRDKFSSLQSAPFEYYTDREDFYNIVDFKVIFKKSRR